MGKTKKNIQNGSQKGRPKHQKYIRNKNREMMASNDDPGGEGAPHGERGFPLIAQYPGSVYIGDVDLSIYQYMLSFGTGAYPRQ